SRYHPGISRDGVPNAPDQGSSFPGAGDEEPAMRERIVGEGITFDDVLLLPGYSEVVPSEIEVRSRFTRHVALNIPISSSPSDTVTEAALAVALGYEGGIGVIHKNMTSQDQAREVVQVKRTVSGVIVDPVTVGPTAKVGAARRLMQSHRISGLPITDGER